MHNVWTDCVEKYVTFDLKKILSDGLEEIVSYYCHLTDLTAVMYAYHTEFSITANYPKVYGELFQD